MPDRFAVQQKARAFNTHKKKENIEQFQGLEPIGRFGLPEEIANTVVWMCSDEASFVTGHAMAVDGGFVAK